jgi:hypothetical protein
MPMHPNNEAHAAISGQYPVSLECPDLIPIVEIPADASIWLGRFEKGEG